MAGVASSRMGDRPGCLATNPCHIHTKRVPITTVPPPPYEQKTAKGYSRRLPDLSR